MKPIRSIVATVLLSTTIAAHAQATDAHLAAVLSQMDAASQRFTSAHADFSKEIYERVSRDTTTNLGSIYFERKGGATQMGAVVFNPKTRARDNVYEYRDGLLRILDPANNQIRVIKPDSNHGQIETFLTLGFGGSGADLAKAWTITDRGTETLNDSGQAVKVEKLDLVSKDPGVRNTFTLVTIWVDPTRDVSLKQVFETPSHDKYTTTYSGIKLNGKIDRGLFELTKDKKTTIVGP
jgi:outer membrane lipoprotein-sorting protein